MNHAQQCERVRRITRMQRKRARRNKDYGKGWDHHAPEATSEVAEALSEVTSPRLPANDGFVDVETTVPELPDLTEEAKIVDADWSDEREKFADILATPAHIALPPQRHGFWERSIVAVNTFVVRLFQRLRHRGKKALAKTVA
jgi:hypothetical protein